jgi:hypothetical protein
MIAIFDTIHEACRLWNKQTTWTTFGCAAEAGSWIWYGVHRPHVLQALPGRAIEAGADARASEMAKWRNGEMV